MESMSRDETSWQGVSEWYGKTVGQEGHFYHRSVILPRSLQLLDLKPGSSLLDLACGQGVLARRLPKGVYYTGVDIAPDLIKQAKSLDKDRNHVYLVADASKELPLPKSDFTHAASILALQNVRDPDGVVRNAARHLQVQGKFLVVLNHPCFRIPRQSRWEIDEQNKTEYRRVDRYLSPLKVPIRMSPGQGEKSEVTWTYHLPLSGYSKMLADNGFVIELLEEWASPKSSVGKAARMENRAREEFPLFLAILAKKE